MRMVTAATTCLLVALSGTPSLATSTPRYHHSLRERPKTQIRLTGLEEDGLRATPGSRPVFGSSTAVGAAGAPGTSVGATYWDFQARASNGRQIDQFNGVLQTVFTAADAPEVDSRRVKWNRVAVAGSPTPVVLDNGAVIGALPLGTPLLSNGLALPGGEAQYANLHVRPGGKAIATFDGRVEFNSWVASLDLTAGNGVFQPHVGPQPAGAQYSSNPLWLPHSAVSVGCGDTNMHVWASNYYSSAWELWYWHGTLSAGTVTWDAPQFLDNNDWTEGVIEARDNQVAVSYLKLDDTWWGNLYYRLSTDCGATWSPATNISNWTQTSVGYAPWPDMAAVFDEDGALHIIWATLSADDAEETWDWIPASIQHWNSQRQTVRTVTGGSWSNLSPEGCANMFRNGMGENDLIFCDMSLSVKPAGMGPGSGIADELLYCTWVQGGPTTTDCARVDSTGIYESGVNTEIFCSVSSDDGFTWDRPVNLTGTETPDCLPGDCHSERWVTAAARADSGLHLSFVDDRHPGAGNYGNGAWCLSAYKVLAVEARLPTIAPLIAVGPTTQYLELHAPTIGSNSVAAQVGNMGNAPLAFHVVVTNDEDGPSHVLVNGGSTYDGSVPAGGAPEALTVTFDGIGLPDPSEWNWRIEVTSNDSANNPGQGGQPIDIMLNVFVADTWYTCAKDTVSTGQHRLALNSCLKLGDAGSGGGLYSYAHGSEWIFEASPVLAWQDGATKRAYRDIFWSDVTDRSRAENKGFRAQSDVMIWRDTTVMLPDTSYPADVARGVASSTDSLFQLDWQVTTFKGPSLSAGAVMQYLVTNRTGTIHAGLHLGAAADLDVDSMAEANYLIVSSEDQFIGAQGGVRDSVGLVSLQQKFAALFYIPLDSGCQDRAAGAQALDNVDYTYPESAYNTDSLYNVMHRMSGFDSSILQADTATDLNVVMVNVQDATLGPNDSLKFAFGFALSDVSLEDLAEKVALLRHTINPRCLVGCPITLTGDVNLNGSITSADIISLVNFVFKGGAGPQPCTAAGDVNCNGSVTSADIIALVNFVFKGGPSPCDACAASSLAVDC